MTRKFFHRLISSFLTLAVMFAGVTPAMAADGSLDPTFGNGGKVTTAFGNDNDTGFAIAIQPDGKVIAAGTDWEVTGLPIGNINFGLARYNSNGSLDATFGVDGKVSTDFNNNEDFGAAIAIQPDGKILMSGQAFIPGSGYLFGLTRYNSDGTLDNTFDTDGKVTTAFGFGEDYGGEIALQPDGKIIVAGSSEQGGHWDIALARYNSEGSLDTTFGTDGKVITDFGGRNDFGMAVALQPDGRIVVAGKSEDGNNVDFALARYNTDGSLDTTFDSDGIVISNFAKGDFAYDLALQPDGKIILAGAVIINDSNFALARYNSDGSLDATFDSDGLVTTDFGDADTGYAVVLQPDGRIVLAGTSLNTNSPASGGIILGGGGSAKDFALVRYNSDGSLDTTLDSDGMIETDFSNGDDEGRAVALQPDNKIVVAGYSHNGIDNDFALARYDVDASPIEVTIDIKPGRPGNRIELKKNVCKGDDNLYVAILTTPDFNAIMNTDATSLTLGDPLSGQTASPVHSRAKDVDRDGDMDIALTFSLCELVTQGALNTNSTELVLRGMTLDGTAISGRDSVNVVGPNRPGNRAPVFIYPVDGQTLDYEGSYLFKVKPIPSAEGFLWGFFQNGVMVWENYRDEGTLSGNEYGIHPGSIAHSKFAQGDVEVWVRASIKGQWTDATVITIHLQPRSP